MKIFGCALASLLALSGVVQDCGQAATLILTGGNVDLDALPWMRA